MLRNDGDEEVIHFLVGDSLFVLTMKREALC